MSKPARVTSKRIVTSASLGAAIFTALGLNIAQSCDRATVTDAPAIYETNPDSDDGIQVISLRDEVIDYGGSVGVTTKISPSLKPTSTPRPAAENKIHATATVELVSTPNPAAEGGSVDRLGGGIDTPSQQQTPTAEPTNTDPTSEPVPGLVSVETPTVTYYWGSNRHPTPTPTIPAKPISASVAGDLKTPSPTPYAFPTPPVWETPTITTVTSKQPYNALTGFSG